MIRYGIIKAPEPEFPYADLRVVPHSSGRLTVRHPAFGPDTFLNNLAGMQEVRSHPLTSKPISFRPPTIDESLSAAAYEFGTYAKPEIFDPKWLQLGHIVRTAGGVFANPPRDKTGKPILDEKTLMSLLANARKVKGVLLGVQGLGFAPYKTFKQGVQSAEDFADSGLVRLLEHAEKPTNLRKIASPYKRGVNVFRFEAVSEPVLGVAYLGSDVDLGSSGLVVGGDWDDDGGFAFGVLDGAEGTGAKLHK